MTRRKRASADEAEVPAIDPSAPIEIPVSVRTRTRSAQTIHVAAQPVQVDSLVVTFDVSPPPDQDPSQPIPGIKLELTVPLKDANMSMMDKQRAEAINKDLYHSDKAVREEAQAAQEQHAQEASDFNDAVEGLYAIGSKHTLTITSAPDSEEE